MQRKNDETPKAGTNEVSILSATCKELTMKSIATQISTINVPFHGQSLATIFHEGQPFVAMRPIVENIGIDWAGQTVKLKKQKEKFGCCDISTPSNGGVQSMLCLPLKKLNGWLFSINPERVRADIKDKLIQYQEECFSVLYEYWSKGEVKPKVSKTTVDERTPLRDAVNMLVGKKGLRYDDAYNMVHQRFSIDSIDELELAQIPLAVEYIHRIVLEGEFIGRLDHQAEPDSKPQYRYLTKVTIADNLFGGEVEFIGAANDFNKMATGICTTLGLKPLGFSHVDPQFEKMKRIH